MQQEGQGCCCDHAVWEPGFPFPLQADSHLSLHVLPTSANCVMNLFVGSWSILIHQTVACSQGGDIELGAFLATVAEEDKKERQEVRVCVSQLKEFTPWGWHPAEKSPG